MEGIGRTEDARHPIGVVASRTGLPQDLIRAWERRYQAVVPGRSATGRRLYSDADVERLKLLKRCVAAGRRIGDVAALSGEALLQLIAEDARATDEVAAAPVRRLPVNAGAKEIIEESLEAIAALDRHRFQAALAEAAISLSRPQLRRDVLVPLLEHVGDRWREGSIRVVHEHLASAIVRTFLGSFVNGTAPNAPRIVVTTPSGQYHELGALMAAAAADEHGWNVYYLGPNLPAEEVAAAVRQSGARAVALSIAYRDEERRTGEELRRLRSYLDPEIVIFIGGRAAPGIERLVEDLDIRLIEDIGRFENELSSLER